MSDSPRLRRLRSDFKALEKLKSESTIFDFEAYGSPADHYVLLFRGRGLFRPENAREEVLTRLQHEVVLRLGAGYPRHAPSLTWRTPIFHPNIASSGTVCLGAYGQHWAPSVTLDELCHMLWDIVRYANFDVDSPYNREAAIWTRAADKATFPLDARPLRDITAGLNSLEVVVPKSPIPVGKLIPTNQLSSDDRAHTAEVIFIEEEDIVDAEIVETTPPPQPPNDEILYIN